MRSRWKRSEGLTAADYEAEYDNRARVPEHPEIIAGWERDAAAYRAARREHSELGLAYGSHPRQTIDLFHPDQPDDAARSCRLHPRRLLAHLGAFDLQPFGAGMNARGYAVALPGYRLCPEVAVADIIDDVRAAPLFHLIRRFGSALRRGRALGRRPPRRGDRRHRLAARLGAPALTSSAMASRFPASSILRR